MDSYDYNTLECRLKAAQAQLRAFKSGEGTPGAWEVVRDAERAGIFCIPCDG